MAAPGQQTPPFPAPQDQDLKNIIDKLANFVARNGAKFEEMTKSKQKDNPKFSFLFGGEYFNYYKWKVSVEIAQGKLVQPQQQSQTQPSFPNSQAAIVQQAIVQQSIQSAPWQQAQQTSAVVPRQHTSGTPAQQQAQETQQSYISQTDINIPEFESHLVKIMQSCTKDNISNGKNWIFKNCKTNDRLKQVADYMLLRVTGAGMGFLHKLHIIYLINDVLHHSLRKSTQEVKSVFQDVIVPIYCCTFVGESPENQQRLGKVIRIWETNNYFSSEIIEKMKNAGQTQEPLKSSDVQGYVQSGYDYQQFGQNQYAPYDTSSYEQPANDTDETTEPTNEPANENQGANEQPPGAQGTGQKQTVPEIDKHIPPVTAPTPAEIQVEKQPIDQFEPQQPPHPENIPFSQVPPHPHPDPNYPYPRGNFPYDHPPEFHQFPPPGFPRPPFNQPPPGFNGPIPPFDHGFVRPPPPSMGYPHGPPQQFDYNHGFPDHPPSNVRDYHHGQAAVPLMEEPPPPAPQAMYYELPAGLMVPLITSPDVNYEPLNSEDIKLPPPQPPSERLMNAVEAFYSPPSHERPRNSDGWEAGALHEFYKIKLPFIKEREVREKIEKVKEMAMKKTEAAKSPENQKRSRSRSRSKSRGRSTSLSPKRRSRSRSPRRRSRSKSRSRSRSPRRRRSRSRSRSKSRSRSRSRSRSPRRRRSVSRERSPPLRRRSPTPPSFAGAYLQTSLNTRIDETNVGHKLLKKMGWEGAGLGKAEQGIQDPIKQGEVRDKQDMYKGIGVEVNDPFSQYRKNMSYSFNRPRRDRR